MASVAGASASAARVIVDPVRGDRLVGYVVVDDGVAVDSGAVRESMTAHVPGYMVPDVVVGVGALPLTANGKLDRDALPEPDAVEVEFVAPSSPEEDAVARVFAELVGVDQVSVAESFFDLGGNSLSAARLAARVGDALGWRCRCGTCSTHRASETSLKGSRATRPPCRR